MEDMRSLSPLACGTVGWTSSLARHVRGKGLMFCMEMVADRTTKTPLDKESIGKIFSGAYDAGVMVRISGNNLICSPPLIITEAETQNLLDGIEAGLRAATANG